MLINLDTLDIVDILDTLDTLDTAVSRVSRVSRIKGIGLDTLEPPDEKNDHAEGINLVAAYRALLRAFAHLESSEYTSENDQQAAVWGHDDLPDPASVLGTRRAE